MRRGAQLVIILLLAAVVAMGGLLIARGRRQAGGSPDTVVVFAPCGLTGPLNATTAIFRQTHPEIRLEVVFDNANILVRRVRDGERPDLFISPGELEMAQLADEGHIDRGTIRDFGSLDVVLFAPSKTEHLNALADLVKPEIKSVSMGDPRYNSIGFYGEKALRSLKLWEPIQSKLVLREFPLEAVTLVSEGRVDAGITYLTCPLDTAPEKASKSDLRVVAKIPRDAYPPVRLQVGMLKATAQRQLCQKFVDFLLSEQAQRALGGQGLLPAPKERT